MGQGEDVNGPIKDIILKKILKGPSLSEIRICLLENAPRIASPQVYRPVVQLLRASPLSTASPLIAKTFPANLRFVSGCC